MSPMAMSLRAWLERARRVARVRYNNHHPACPPELAGASLPFGTHPAMRRPVRFTVIAVRACSRITVDPRA